MVFQNGVKNIQDAAYNGARTVKYRGPILRVMSQALGSDDSTLDQSATSIQIILPEPAVT